MLFIDEIHRLGRPVEEILYPAMEDFQLDIVVGKGPAASSIRLPLPRFTMVGDHRAPGLITGPLRDRFGFVVRLDFYASDDLEWIALRAAAILGVPIDARAHARSRGGRAALLASRTDCSGESATSPRCEATARSISASPDGLALFGVDRLGLDKVDRAILRTICERFGGGPVGLSTLAISVGEQPETVEDVYEPFLMQQGLLQRTPRRAYRVRRGVRASRPGAARRATSGWALRRLIARSDRPDQTGRCVERKSEVIAHAAFAASGSKNIGAS